MYKSIKSPVVLKNNRAFMNNYMPIIIFVTKNSHTSPEKILTKYGV